jgi:hypothetical protein
MMAAEKYVTTQIYCFSRVLTAENSSINYALRVLKPVLDGDVASVEVTAEAESNYAYWVQDALNKRVWNAGCVSVRILHGMLGFFSSDTIFTAKSGILTTKIGTRCPTPGPKVTTGGEACFPYGPIGISKLVNAFHSIPAFYDT